MAAIAHGSARLTQDLDIAYRRTSDNISRLASALAPYSPYPRGAPPGLPFRWDAETLRRGRVKDFEAIAELEALRQEGSETY